MIKRIFLIIFSISLLFLLSFFIFNFFKKDKNIFSSLITDFQANMIIITGEKEIECEVSHNKENTSIKLTKPKNLDGLLFNWDSSGKQKISFKGIIHEFNSNLSSEHSYLNLLVHVFNSMHDISKLKNIEDIQIEDIKFEGEVLGHKFEFISDRNGLLKEVNIPSKNIKAILQTTPNSV